jgi:hypothetical protein
MEFDLVTARDTIKGTYSEISKTLPLAVLLTLATPLAIDANSLVNLNAQQTKYEIEVTPQVAFKRSTITLWKAQMTEEFKPKTEFVKKLLALREQAILNGMKLLTVDEILAEKRALRGEID